MTRLLLDTNVVSELQRTRRAPTVDRWWHTVADESLYLSVLTLGEIERGITRLRTRDTARADALARWTEAVRDRFDTRILPVDDDVALCWGSFSADRSRSVIDTLLAATAVVNRMTLVTRNVRDFEGLPVRLLNPFND